MVRKYRRIFFALIIIGLIMGCQAVNPNPPSISAELPTLSQNPPVIDPKSTITATPTLQAISLTPTIQVSPTTELPAETPQDILATPTFTISNPDISQQCIEIQNGHPSDILENGKLVFWGDNGLIFFNAENIEPGLLKAVVRGGSGATSENGEWLIYNDGDLNQMIVLSTDGDVATALPWDPWDGETQWFRWFDDERLILYSSTRPYEANLILNPFTGEKIEVLASFSDPEYYDYEYDPHLTWGFPVVYDSHLTRAIYLRKNGLVLWDLLNREPLWHIDHVGAELARPVWSPDQSYAIVTLTKYPQLVYELFRVDRDGGITQLTNFEAVYPSPQIFHPLKWSPDGRYLAFWFYTSEEPFDPNAEARLMVWDMGMNKITDYCIGDIPGSTRDDSIIWSPDSQQLVITIDHFWEKTAYVVVDLLKREAVLIDIPWLVGWLGE